MTDEATPYPDAPASAPVPPAYPPGSYPVAGYPSGRGYPATGEPPRKRRGWILALVIVVIVLAGLASCTALAITMGRDTGATTGWGGLGDAVAVIRLDGVISGSSGSGSVTPETIIRQLDQVKRDNSIKAIVLRVDSPGGTVAASEEIAQLIKDESKPVVVSIGDVGASGAYMVASQADVIYAIPGSTVGSIGVIAEIPNVEGLLKKLGVEMVIITAGKYKGTGSGYQPLTAEERKLLQQDVDIVYNQFIDIVAQGRKMNRAEVQKLANGWAWPGTKAKQLGLVDRIGGFSDAVNDAAKRGGIQGEPRIVEFTQYSPAALVRAILGSSSALKFPFTGATESLAK